jgi:hypothetical protein
MLTKLLKNNNVVQNQPQPCALITQATTNWGVMLHVRGSKKYSILLNKIQAYLQIISMLLTFINNRWLPGQKTTVGEIVNW